MVARTRCWRAEPGGVAPTAARLREHEASDPAREVRVLDGEVDSEGFLLDGCRADSDGGAMPALLNVHHDRNNQQCEAADAGRVATFMVYLSTVDAAAGHGGETFFPAADAPRGDTISRDLRAAYRRGTRALERTEALALECEARLWAWRAAGGPAVRRGGADYVGVGAAAAAGTALVFDAAGRDAEGGAWHAPCVVTGPEEKWTLTWFKACPR